MTTTVRKTILGAFDGLSPKQRKLARFLMDDEEVAAFASANEIASRVGVSPATVVRFARSLGYDGYPTLQQAVRAEFPQFRTVAQKMADRLADSPGTENLAQQVARASDHDVRATLARVTQADLDSAIRAIIAADQIYIFGSGLSAAAATLAEYTLTLLGFNARAFHNEGVSQALQLSHLTARDTIIVFSIWRYIRSSVAAAEAARDAGATVIALTDSSVSPVAGLAHTVFVAETAGAAHSRSLAGLLSIVDLLGAAIAAKRPQESIAAVERLDGLFRKNNLLLSD